VCMFVYVHVPLVCMFVYVCVCNCQREGLPELLIAHIVLPLAVIN